MSAVYLTSVMALYVFWKILSNKDRLLCCVMLLPLAVRMRRMKERKSGWFWPDLYRYFWKIKEKQVVLLGIIICKLRRSLDFIKRNNKKKQKNITFSINNKNKKLLIIRLIDWLGKFNQFGYWRQKNQKEITDNYTNQ